MKVHSSSLIFLYEFSVLSLHQLDLEPLKHFEELAPQAQFQPGSWGVNNLELGEHFGGRDLDLIEGEALSDAHPRSS